MKIYLKLSSVNLHVDATLHHLTPGEMLDSLAKWET